MGVWGQLLLVDRMKYNQPYYAVTLSILREVQLSRQPFFAFFRRLILFLVFGDSSFCCSVADQTGSKGQSTSGLVHVCHAGTFSGRPYFASFRRCLRQTDFRRSSCGKLLFWRKSMQLALVVFTFWIGLSKQRNKNSLLCWATDVWAKLKSV